MISCYTDKFHSLCPITGCWTFGMFPVFKYCHLNSHVQVSEGTCFHSSSDDVKEWHCWVLSVVCFLGNFWVVVPFHTHPVLCEGPALEEPTWGFPCLITLNTSSCTYQSFLRFLGWNVCWGVFPVFNQFYWIGISLYELEGKTSYRHIPPSVSEGHWFPAGFMWESAGVQVPNGKWCSISYNVDIFYHIF